jgi:hypothetical protein
MRLLDPARSRKVLKYKQIPTSPAANLHTHPTHPRRLRYLPATSCPSPAFHMPSSPHALHLPSTNPPLDWSTLNTCDRQDTPPPQSLLAPKHLTNGLVIYCSSLEFERPGRQSDEAGQSLMRRANSSPPAGGRSSPLPRCTSTKNAVTCGF